MAEYLISSGIVFTSISLSYDSMYISNGGVANSTTVNSGGYLYISSGGVANSTTVNNGGYLYISSGGEANSTTVNYWGSMNIVDGGVANNATVNNSGRVYISNGGEANSTTVNNGYMHISSGGVANSTTINSGGVFISSGGVANSITVNFGGNLYIGNAYSYDAGVANSTTVNDYGSMWIYNGGVTNLTTVSGGKMYISSGGIANSTTVNDYGSMRIFSGGTANSTTVNNFGRMYVFSGGAANSTTVLNNGSTIVTKGGEALDTVVEENGSMLISNGGQACKTTVHSGAVMTVIQSSYAEDITLSGSLTVAYHAVLNSVNIKNSGTLNLSNYKGGGSATNVAVNLGQMHISSGAWASGVSVNTDGMIYISSGGTLLNAELNGYAWLQAGAYVSKFQAMYGADLCMDITPDSFIQGNYNGSDFIVSQGNISNYELIRGALYVRSGGTATATNVNCHGLYVYGNGFANDTIVNSGGRMTISSGGIATDTIVSGGNLDIFSGGIAADTIVSSGYLSISSGGKISGELDIASGGVVSAYAGAIVDFDISNRTSENAALINNLSLIKGAPDYTITVSTNQACGNYKLAQGASAFSGSVTVYADGSSLGTLSVDETLQVADNMYKLNLTDDVLLLTIAGTPNVNDKGFAYSGNCDSTLQDDVEMLIDGGSYKRFYGGNYVEKSKQFVDIAGSVDLTVNGGTFSSVVAGGDHVVDGIVERTGAITVVINGGTFKNNVAGGMCLDIAADNFGQVNAIVNDINLTIAGGTFAKRVFGGNISAKVAQSGHADVKGNINLTIDATASDITFSENIAAGSSGYSWVHGNVTVTLKKSASYTLDMQGLLSGGGEGAVYVSGADGSRTATSYVAGERTLVLDSYIGEFAGTLFMFENLEAKNNTAIEFTNENINLRDIDSWQFEYGSSIEGIARNSFTGDTLDFDLTGWNNAEDWIVMSGSENAFDTIAEAENVILGGQNAQWNGSVWTSTDYTLTLEENNQKLVLAKSNA